MVNQAVESLQALIISVLLWFYSAFFALLPQEQQLSWNGLDTQPLLQCGVSLPARGDAAALPTPFSVAVWNVYKWQRDGSYARLAELAETSDLLLFQEAVGTERLSAALDGFSWHLNQAFSKDGLSVGVLTASKIPPARLCGERLMEPWLGLPKTLLVTEYALQQGNVALLVINLHGVNFTLDIEVYRAQLEQVRQAADNHAGPILLAGDFNSWSASRQLALRQLASELDLQTVVFEDDDRSSMFGHPLDGIWMRGLAVVTAEVLSTPSSDHNAMLAKFALEENGSKTATP
jgi:endonuclease/exonuclease/phosphatase (EEP) superfamily protein YafD